MKHQSEKRLKFTLFTVYMKACRFEYCKSHIIQLPIKFTADTYHFPAEGSHVSLLVHGGGEVRGEGRLKVKAGAELVTLLGHGQLAGGALTLTVSEHPVPLSAVVTHGQAVGQLSHAEPVVGGLHSQLHALVFAEVHLQVTS